MNTGKPEILITKKFPDDVTAPLRRIAIVHQWQENGRLMPREEVMAMAGRLTGIINQAELKVDDQLLSGNGKLKIVANVSLGSDNLDLGLMTTRGVWASNTPGFFDYPVAEYALGGIITVMRRLAEADRFVRSGAWKTFQPGYWDGDSLSGKTLGLVGMGSIAASLAQMASCLGMHVIYHNRSGGASHYERVELPALLSRADVVSVHVPYSKATHELIGDEQFAMMKPGAIFVNTSRGKVVDEPALVRHLSSGHLRGAVLDVFYHEPAVPEALIAMPNVLLTPHLAGGTRAGRISSYKLAVENVVRVLEGQRPVSPLNEIK